MSEPENENPNNITNYNTLWQLQYK
jgi:hypothetical protein